MNERTTPNEGIPDGHPPFETLRAYHADELEPEEDEALREHLAGCDDCAAVVLELAGLAPEPAEAVELTEMDAARAWRKMRARLREDREAKPRRQRPPYRILALAATIVVAAAVSFFFRQTPGMRVTLEPWDPSRGSQGARPCTSLPAARAWTLRLPVRDEPAFPTFRLEIRTEDQRLLATHEPEPTDGGFAVEMAGTDLPPGRYRLFLVGQDGDEPVVIEQYCAEVSDAD